MKPFDLQVNGYAGVDFCAPQLTGEELESACSKLRQDGVDSILATVITDSLESMEAKLSRLAELREQSPLIGSVIAGLHIEGPFLNPASGYIGAHPSGKAIPASVDAAMRLLDAARGLARVVTLAPERDPGRETIGRLSEEGVTVSAGHCNPSLEALAEAIDRGLSMVTHFGNGCPVELPRHDNVLQRFLHFRKDLWFCFITDGAHVDAIALKNYIDFVGIDRSIAVSDAICASGEGPGRYAFSGMELEVDGAGVARKPGSENLAGSTVTMPRMRDFLVSMDFEPNQIEQLIDLNPRAALEG